MFWTLLLVTGMAMASATFVNYAHDPDTTCDASSEYSTSYPCENAIDASLATFWYSVNEDNAWVELTFPKYIYVHYVKVLQHIYTSPLHAEKIEVVYSYGESITVDGMHGLSLPNQQVWTTQFNAVPIPTTTIKMIHTRKYPTQNYGSRIYDIYVIAQVNYAMTERGATCSESNTVTGHECSKALDSSSATYFETTQGAVGEYIEVTFETPKIVKSVNVVQENEKSNFHASILGVSFNGETPINVDGSIGGSVGTNQVRNELSLEAAILTTTIRLTVQGVKPPVSQSVVKIYELEAFEPRPMKQACIAFAYDVSASISEMTDKLKMANFLQAAFAEMMKDKRMDVFKLQIVYVPFNEGAIHAERLDGDSDGYDSVELFKAYITPLVDDMTEAVKTRVPSGYTDLAATLDYLADETCQGELRVAVVISDFNANQNPEGVDDAVENLVNSGSTIVAVVLDKKRSMTNFFKLKEGGYGIDMKRDWRQRTEAVFGDLYTDRYVQYQQDAF